MRSHARRLLCSARPSPRWWLGIVLALIVQSALAQAPAAVETILNNMLSAMQTGSLEEFSAAGDASFKAAMTKELLNGVSAQVASRLKEGYTSTFLGTVKQQGYVIYLWRLEFKDGKDDRLVTMPVKDGKVGGFFLR
jgi:hypothetical protein